MNAQERPTSPEQAKSAPTRPIFVRRMTLPDADSTAVEIEGEARRVEEAAPQTPQPAEHEIRDHEDGVIVASMVERQLAVHPGGTVVAGVDLLNNGQQAATFRVYVEGWIDEQWLTEGPQHVQLRPAERTRVNLTIAPPRRATSPAGEHPFVVIVRSSDYPHHMARLGAVLIVHPYTELAVGRLQPQAATLGWLAPRATFSLPVTNLSNRAVTVQMYGQSSRCTFEFRDLGTDAAQQGVAQFQLASQQTMQARVRVHVRPLPWFGMGNVPQPLAVAVGVLGEPRLPRTASAELRIAPIVKLWHGAALAVLLFIGVALMGMLLFTSQIALQLSQFSPAAPNPPAAAPVLTIILNQSPATPTTAAGLAAAPPLSDRTPLKTLPDGPVGGPQSAAEAQASGLPVVQPEQVTAPGQSVAPRPTAQHSASGMTYAQMFQQVALQFDLDWRMLAAQAYVESSFDSLALGEHGDMGLMQVLPATWREWAPTVGVNDPFDAYSNALVAAAYLDYLRTLLSQRGYTQAQWMLIAYNWGPDKLLEFLADGGAWDQLPAVRQKYATEIMSIARSIP